MFVRWASMCSTMCYQYMHHVSIVAAFFLSKTFHISLWNTTIHFGKHIWWPIKFQVEAASMCPAVITSAIKGTSSMTIIKYTLHCMNKTSVNLLAQTFYISIASCISSISIDFRLELFIWWFCLNYVQIRTSTYCVTAHMTLFM